MKLLKKVIYEYLHSLRFLIGSRTNGDGVYGVYISVLQKRTKPLEGAIHHSVVVGTKYEH